MNGLIYTQAFGEPYHEMARAQQAAIERFGVPATFACVHLSSGKPPEICRHKADAPLSTGEYDWALFLEPDVEIVSDPMRAIVEMIDSGRIHVQAGPTSIRRLYPPKACFDYYPAPWSSFVFVPKESFGFFDLWAQKCREPIFFEERTLLESLQPYLWTYATCVRNATEPNHGDPFVHRIGPHKQSVRSISAAA